MLLAVSSSGSSAKAEPVVRHQTRPAVRKTVKRTVPKRSPAPVVHSRRPAVKPAAARGQAVKPRPATSRAAKAPPATKKPVPKATASDHPLEPKTPPGYETQTQLLARAYRLRDQALNEQMKGDHGLAVKHLMDATQLTAQYYGKSVPQEALLYYDLGVAAATAEQNELARESFRQCLERDSNMSEAQMQLAMVLARQGKQSEALTYARQAVRLQPEDSRAHLVLSLLLERQGHLAEAKAEKDKARKLAKAAGITTPRELQESIAAPESPDRAKAEPEVPQPNSMPLPADSDPEL